jgi:DNA-binding NtrC family response regulator
MSENIGTARLLIVDDEEIVLKDLQHIMSREGYAVTATKSGARAMALLEAHAFDVVLTDLRLENVDGMDILKKCRERHPDSEVILITAYATAESAVKAMKQGAFYYVSKPFRLDEVRKVVAEAVAKVTLRRENQALREQLDGYRGPVRIVTHDPAMLKLLDMARQVGPTDCSVLISGESGTGKELFARYLHHHSSRRDGPYTAVNCGAFSADLLANELFGHEKGAFTGATTMKKGLVEAGAGGTLFLDEVTEMPPAMQVKLLRVLQEREVLRLGGTRPIKVDVRIVAASNRQIAGAVASGAFRRDLYFRINVVDLHIPPLSERRDDVPLLVQHFLQKCTARMNKKVTGVSPAAMAVLMDYDFPGNVRELENIIERGAAVTPGDTIDVEHLPAGLGEVAAVRRRDGRMPTLEEQEMDYIQRVLREVGGNQSAAAQVLGINRSSLWRKLKGREEGDG